MRMFLKVAAVAVIACIVAAGEEAASPLTVPLKGLSKDNATKVETALAKLERNAFRCPTCEYFSAKEGECPGCGAALVADKAGILLREVKIDPEKGVAMFGVAGRAGVRLSEIDAILKPTGVTIDRSQLLIVPFTRITLTGIESKENGEAIEKALRDAKLFDTVKAAFDPDHKMGVLIVGGTKKAPSFEALSAVIGKAGEDFAITEVSWIAACPKCKQKGMNHAGCTSCWEQHT